MPDRPSGSSTTTSSPSTAKRHEDRNVWVLTAYAISGLVLFGVLLYFVSGYLAQ